MEATSKTKDLPHGLPGRRRRRWGRRRPTLEDKMRLRGTLPLSLDFGDSGKVLPQVDPIRGFVIRRKCFPTTSIKSLTQMFRESLRSLEMFRHEWVRHATKSLQVLTREGRFWFKASLFCYQCTFLVGPVPYDTETNTIFLYPDYRDHLLPHLPSTLRQLYISPEADYYLGIREVKHQDYIGGVRLARSLCQQLTELASTEAGLAHGILYRPPCEGSLSSSEISEPYTWPRLQYIVLKAILQCPNSARVNNGFLRDVGQIVLRMPELKAMELWDIRAESAVIFRYSITGNSPSITWLDNGRFGTTLQLGTVVIKSWQETARIHGHRQLVINRGQLPFSTEEFRLSRGRCFLCHLELKRLLFDPRTFHQLQFEGKHGTRF